MYTVQQTINTKTKAIERKFVPEATKNEQIYRSHVRFFFSKPEIQKPSRSTHQPPEIVLPCVVPPVTKVVTTGGNRYSSNSITPSGGHQGHHTTPFSPSSGIHGQLRRRGYPKAGGGGFADLARFGYQRGLLLARKCKHCPNQQKQER